MTVRLFAFTLVLAAVGTQGQSPAQTQGATTQPPGGGPSQSSTTTTGQIPANKPHAPASLDQYALGKLNPDNKDYGSAISHTEASVVSWTIDDLYFWSDAVSIAALAAVAGFMILQLRAWEKKERICAELIAQLWNGRVSDGLEIAKRTAEHNALVDRCNAQMEQPSAMNEPTRSRKSSGEGEFREVPQVEMTLAKTSGPTELLRQVAPEVPAVPPVEIAAAIVTPQPIASHEPAEVIEPVVSREAASLDVAPKKEVPVRELPPVEDSETKRLRAEIDRLTQEGRKWKAQGEALTNVEKNLKIRLNEQQEYINSLKQGKDRVADNASPKVTA